MPQYLLCFLMFAVSVGGAAIQAASGFGYGIFVMAVIPFFMPYGDALCSSGLISLITAARIAFMHRRYIDLKLTAVPVLAYLVTGFLGTFFLQGRADEHLRRVLGAFLIALSRYLIFCSHRIRVGAGPVSGAVAGGLSGFMGSLFSMSGPPIVIYLLAATAENLVYIANIQVYFLFTGTYIALVRLLHGMMNLRILIYTLCGFLGVCIGTALGNAVFRKLDAKSLRLTVYSFMALAGLLFLLGA